MKKTVKSMTELEKEIETFIKALGKLIYACTSGTSEPIVSFFIISYAKNILSSHTFWCLTTNLEQIDCRTLHVKA